MTRPRAVVVGGGLAGIAAACELADGGCEVTVCEVRPRLGGAAYSFERDGLELDNGQHVFLRCCTEYRRLLARIGSSSSTVLQRRLSIPVISRGRLDRLYRVPLPAPLHLGPALARYGLLGGSERLHVTRTALALRRLDRTDPALDQMTFGQWLTQHGETDDAIAALWDLITLPTLNLPAAEASAALGVMVFQTGLLSSASAGDVGYSAVPLSRLHGEPALRALRDAGVDVRLATRVERVVEDGDALAVTAGEDAIPADTVIVAVQHSRVGALLPSGALSDMRALGTSPIVNLHVVYDRRVMELPFAAAVGSPVQWLFDRTDSSGLRGGQCLAISVSGAERESRLSSAQLRDEFLPALEELLPAARQAHVERFVVTKEHAATFRATPGVESVRPGPRTAIERLFVAGAWTRTEWPATMEGAARSGFAAAREALAALASGSRRARVAA